MRSRRIFFFLFNRALISSYSLSERCCMSTRPPELVNPDEINIASKVFQLVGGPDNLEHRSPHRLLGITLKEQPRSRASPWSTVQNQLG
ncbi:hypothetical protein F5148DRAFT_1226778 [Russula earlei]|uniref:Uncharacterized protein n=1 Tax=Russula earlei TaxID=71964 RepID=A0ACC0TZW8_9AGAM|nr:hypothetical protein F5148DRAFT_1226778 [Russula earlei]